MCDRASKISVKRGEMCAASEEIFALSRMNGKISSPPSPARQTRKVGTGGENAHPFVEKIGGGGETVESLSPPHISEGWADGR